MPTEEQKEYFIGWNPSLPAPHRKVTRIFLLFIAVLIPVVGAAIALAQQRLPEGTFEFGITRKFEGVLIEKPIPFLRLESMSAQNETETPSADFGPGRLSILLVGFGKSGLPEEARGAHGKRISFEGSLIHGQGGLMAEMNKLDTLKIGETANDSASNELGRVTLRGELVDTKCFFGVMRPGHGKVHRACAINCLKGGVPPGLWVRTEGGAEVVFFLTGPSGEKLEYDYQLAGEIIEITGTAAIQETLPILRAESITRF